MRERAASTSSAPSATSHAASTTSSRPLGPPGRSRRVALLPLGRGRPDPALRRRAHIQDPRPPRPRRQGGQGGAARGEDADEEIEGAQKKVEEQNFLIRKRVLEYDDVMNEQRRVIYGYRREVLEGKDMSEDAREELGEVVSRMVDTYTPGDVLEEWDLGELQTQVQQLWPTQVDLTDLGRDHRPRRAARDPARRHPRRVRPSREGVRRRGHAPARARDPVAAHRQALARAPGTRWTTCARASICAASPRSTRWSPTRTRPSRCSRTLMHAIWEEFARMIFHVEVEVDAGAAELPPAQRPPRQLLGRDAEASRRRSRRPRGARLARRRRASGRRQPERPTPRRRQRRPANAAARSQGRQGEDRPQRPLLVRLGQEVQEVPRRRLSAGGILEPPAPNLACHSRISPAALSRPRGHPGIAALVGLEPTAGLLWRAMS